MFRLKATLVATTLLRPWRTGWSMDRGVDFALTVATPALADPAAVGTRPALAERPCFIDEDWVYPRAGEVRALVQSAVAEAEAEALTDPAAEAPGLQAWYSLAGKLSRT